MATTATHPKTRHTISKRHFARHYLEMIAAMIAGMIVFGGAIHGVLTLTGTGLSTELASLEMAFDMSAGMVIWMRHRGHGWAGTLEMSAAMFAPLPVLFPMLWAGVITPGSLMMLEHLAMLPLMFLVMLRRRHEYAH